MNVGVAMTFDLMTGGGGVEVILLPLCQKVQYARLSVNLTMPLI